MSFDIVIPVGPYDYSVINDTINYTKRNIVGYRNIYIISSIEMHITDCIYISENVFPFGLDIKDKIRERLDEKQKSRVGWYLQQLLKLYCGFYIPDILENYLILDSDVYFLKKTEFMTNEMIPLLTTGIEHHRPYFEHMVKLHPSLIRRMDVSGICHHMMFTKKYIMELIFLIEKTHNKLFWEVFLENIVKEPDNVSGASEYEIYFNFMVYYHPDKINIRNLNWRNIYQWSDIQTIHDYVAFHQYVRPS